MTRARLWLWRQGVPIAPRGSAQDSLYEDMHRDDVEQEYVAERIRSRQLGVLARAANPASSAELELGVLLREWDTFRRSDASPHVRQIEALQAAVDRLIRRTQAAIRGAA